MLASDGSQHDSHQHKQLMDLVDSRFLKIFLPKSLIAKGIPVHLIDPFIQVLTSNTFKITLRYPKIGVVAIKGTLKGTVFSGHTLATTLGNTLRVLAYMYFIAYRAGIPLAEIQPFVSGDDSVVGVPAHRVPAFERSMYEVYATRDFDGTYGLGQVLKASSYIKSSYMTLFLSKFIFIDPANGKVSSFRLPQRFVYTGHATSAVKEVTSNSLMDSEEHATAVYQCMVSGSIPTVYKSVADYVMQDRRLAPTQAYLTSIRRKYIKYANREAIFEYKQAYGGDLVQFSRQFKMLEDVHYWRNRVVYSDIIIDDGPLRACEAI